MQHRSRLLLVAWGTACAWLLGAMLAGSVWAMEPVGITAAVGIALTYFAVPVLYAFSIEKGAALVACVVAIAALLAATGLQVVYGRFLGLSALLGNLFCMVTHALMGVAAVAVLVTRETPVVLPAAWSVVPIGEGAAEQGAAPAESRKEHAQ